MEPQRSLNLKRKLKISGIEYDFELYTIHKRIVKEIMFDNKIYCLIEEKEEIPKNTSEVSESNVDPKKKQKRRDNKGSAIFDEKDLICKVHSIRIYRPLVDYLTENLPEGIFELAAISAIITKYYTENFDRSLGKKSVENYASGYSRYMASNNILEKLNRFELQLIPPVKSKEKTDRPLKTPVKTPSDPEETNVTIKKDPAKDDTEEFLQWLNKWENSTFTKADVRRCTTLSRMKTERMIDDQLEKGAIKRVSDYEFAKVVLNGTG